MRIAVLPSLIAPVREGACFGGAEMAALSIAEGYARRGHAVTLFAIPGSGGAGLDVWIAPPTPLLRPGERPREQGALEAPFVSIEAELRRRWSAGALDVLHLQLIDPAALRMADRLARSTGLRVLATLHLAAVFPGTTEVVRELWRTGSPVVFTAPSTFALESYGLVPDGRRAHVVPNGVELDAIPFAPTPPTDRRLAWAGRRSREKGLLEALAIAKLGGWPITIAGADAPEATAEDRSALDRARAEVDVEDLGLVPRREVGRLFARAAVTLVTSSIPETQSLVAVESLAAGTPVVAFDVGALREVVTDGVTGLLVPVDGPSRALEDARRAVERVASLSRARCRAEAEDRFGAELMLDRLLAISSARPNT